MKLETVIGLEIHVQLNTRTKMFCPCAIATDDSRPNSSVCPICMGHPGTLPTVNAEAIKKALMLALSLDFTICRESRFARKHYFYPDLPKGYQITQYDEPLAEEGHLILSYGRIRKRIRLERLHVEEDSAKMIHMPGSPKSLVDFNRSGVPLVEIVTKPDFSHASEARRFLELLRKLVRTLDVSDGDMEKAHLRCDANISLRPAPESQQEAIALFGEVAVSQNYWPKTEIKNLNSFKSVEHALQYEITRQTELWNSGNPPMKQSTRGWSDDDRKTVEQRVKEDQADYRYMLEPDLPSLQVSEEVLSEIAAKIPELPEEKRDRLAEQYALSSDVLDVLLRDDEAVSFFEGVASDLEQWMKESHHDSSTFAQHLQSLHQLAATWILSKLYEALRETDTTFITLKMSEENFAELLLMLHKKTINSSTAAMLLKDMVLTGEDPSNLVAKKGVAQIDNEDELVAITQAVLDEHQEIVEQYKSGKTSVLQFLLGKVMQKSNGRANPQTAKKMLETFMR